MSATSRFMPGALALALASVSIVAVTGQPARADDPDQTLEELLGVTPSPTGADAQRSLKIIKPQPAPATPAQNAPDMTAPLVPPAAAPAAADASSPLILPPGSLPIAATQPTAPPPPSLPAVAAIVKASPPPAVVATPRVTTAAAASGGLLPSTVLAALASQPTATSDPVRMGSPIGFPRALPELADELAGRAVSPSSPAPTSTQLSKAAGSWPLTPPLPAGMTGDAGNMIDDIAILPETPLPASGLVPELAPVPALQTVVPETAPQATADTAVLPAQKLAQLGVGSDVDSTASLFAGRQTSGQIDVSAGELLGQDAISAPVATTVPAQSVAGVNPAGGAAPIVSPILPADAPPAAVVTAPPAASAPVAGASEQPAVTMNTPPIPDSQPAQDAMPPSGAATPKTTSKTILAYAQPPRNLTLPANDLSASGNTLEPGELLGRVIFPPFNSSIPPFVREMIRNKILPALRANPGTRVAISGYADWTPNGSVDASMDIGQRRAENVQNYLQEQGIAPGRLLAEGVGVDFLPGVPRDRVDLRVLTPKVQ
jgi:outer membrane protein OmpA-like peptidoglycan-associated protein